MTQIYNFCYSVSTTIGIKWMNMYAYTDTIKHRVKPVCSFHGSLKFGVMFDTNPNKLRLCYIIWFYDTLTWTLDLMANLTVYTLQSTPYSLHLTVYTLQSTPYNLHLTVQTDRSIAEPAGSESPVQSAPAQASLLPMGMACGRLNYKAMSLKLRPPWGTEPVAA